MEGLKFKFRLQLLLDPLLEFDLVDGVGDVLSAFIDFGTEREAHKLMRKGKR